MRDLLDFNDISIQRRLIRKQRRILSPYVLRQSAQQITHKMLRHPKIKTAQHIGLYLDAFGEVPTHQLILALLQQHKQVYLPVICSMTQNLQWRKISLAQLRNQRFTLHRLGMKQPMQGRCRLVQTLDVMVMPLVIFDEQGHRVGMGGGFYDRTLAQHPYRPYRMGLAYDFQKSTALLQQQVWDEPIDAVCTPTRYWQFKR
ncbi:MAG: 5-formyltetrahydrofolate cyclo-ligase [Acinetobacter sp.]|jgi:5-formyltetrahydrofolate cyclo-ligase|nr:MAG: 5-formyltetrahydrofolate cyclo-ligase [Acinetobacter sp.]